MHGGGTVQCRAAIAVVHLVDILVQPWIVEEPVRVVTDRLVVHEQCRDRQGEVQPAVVTYVHV